MLTKKEYILVFLVTAVMMVYFLAATPGITDDGIHYEGFTESLAQGKLDFKSFYGFQGLSFFAVPVFLLTRSHDSIIVMSAIFSLFSVFLAYSVGKRFYQSSQAGLYFMILFLLMPYPYTTMMRGFQEAALLFFILLIIYESLNKKSRTPLTWAVGGIVKPFALVLFPLFIKDFWNSFFDKTWGKKLIWLIVAMAIGGAYLGASYYQTGHLVNNAAINSYQGNFNTGNPPPLAESFTVGVKGFLRIGMNLLLAYRKILISPFIVVLGAISLLFNKDLKLRKEIILAIVLNFLLVGSLTFSFSKYLLPMATLFALVSVGYLLKYQWLMVLVFLDSFSVFMPIWNYFGHNYWPNVYIYLMPLFLGVILFIYERLFEKHNFNPNS